MISGTIKTDEIDDIPICIHKEGKKYELLSCKVEKVKRSNGQYQAAPNVVYEYIKTEENGVVVLNLSEKLEEMCRFGSLSRQKVIARLGHFQSEVRFAIDVDLKNIEIIEEKGHEGCGFFPPGELFDKNIPIVATSNF